MDMKPVLGREGSIFSDDGDDDSDDVDEKDDSSTSESSDAPEKAVSLPLIQSPHHESLSQPNHVAEPSQPEVQPPLSKEDAFSQPVAPSSTTSQHSTEPHSSTSSTSAVQSPAAATGPPSRMVLPS